jgi:hypothetical protein
VLDVDPQSDTQPEASADSATRLRDLEAQVAVMRLFEAARQLLHDYARACDVDDASGVAALFEADGVLHAGARELRGSEQILGFYRDALDKQTCHIVGVASLTALADASVEAASTFLAVEATESASTLRWGTYRDRIVARADRARFAERRITIEGSAGL